MNAAQSLPDRETVEFLCGLKERGVVLGLDRMRHFVATLGNPQERVPVIHVAGTNGKGSVASMIEAVLRGAGWRTGLYTSPHLVQLGERVQVDRHALTPDELATRVRELRPAVEDVFRRRGAESQPSYFEFMTALAFWHFARTSCDIAVVEVGMGGRLDATNIVTPEVSVITSIGFDHCEFLGSTLQDIAREKAGIIQPGRPVVLGRLPQDGERVVRNIAATQHAPIRSIIEEFGSDIANYPETNLSGGYQRVNAATATLAARALGPRWKLAPDVIARALVQVDWPARWQRLRVGGRCVIVDATHNSEGAAELDRNLRDVAAESGQPPIVVAGVLGAARAKPLMDVICRHAREIHLVIPRQKRACSYEELEGAVPATWRGTLVRDTVENIFPAADTCIPGVPADVVVVVTGSIYLAGEALARIDPSRGPVQHELQDF